MIRIRHYPKTWPKHEYMKQRRLDKTIQRTGKIENLKTKDKGNRASHKKTKALAKNREWHQVLRKDRHVLLRQRHPPYCKLVQSGNNLAAIIHFSVP